MRFLFLLLMVFSSVSYGAGTTTAKIDRIMLWEAGNLMYIFPKGGVQDPASCHDGKLNGDYLTMDMSRPMAEEYLSLMMMALTTKKTVTFKTSYPDCPEQSFVESIVFVSVGND